MFRRRYRRRSSFLPFVIFRTILSLAIFGVLIYGGLIAFRQFSGLNLVKLDFQKDLPAIAATVLSQLQIKLPANFQALQVNKQAVGGVQTPMENKQPKLKALLSFKFLLVADSHDDNDNLRKALSQNPGISFVIGLGDYSDVGTLDELQAVKKVLDGAGIRYFVTPGDHDLWDARDKGKDPLFNVTQVFGRPYQSFNYKNVRFLILYNADNYLGLGEVQKSWLNDEINRISQEKDTNLVLAFTHEPLYHPSSIRGMGKVEPKLIDEAKWLTKTLNDNGIKEIFAGDVHYFTQYSEPETNLKMTTIGALTGVRNAQAPRYGIVSVYQDGSYDVEDVEIK